MIIALGDVFAQIPSRDRVRELMRQTQARVAAEPGCLSYVFAETLDDPGHYVTVQQWRDEEALDEHYRSQAFADYQAGIGESLVRSSELRVHAVQGSYVPYDPAPIEPQSTD